MIDLSIERICLGTNMADSNRRQGGSHVDENQELESSCNQFGLTVVHCMRSAVVVACLSFSPLVATLDMMEILELFREKMSIDEWFWLLFRVGFEKKSG